MVTTSQQLMIAIGDLCCYTDHDAKCGAALTAKLDVPCTCGLDAAQQVVLDLLDKMFSPRLAS